MIKKVAIHNARPKQNLSKPLLLAVALHCLGLFVTQAFGGKPSPIDLAAYDFYNDLIRAKNLSRHMNPEGFEMVYQGDNRVRGSFKGSRSGLSPAKIDASIDMEIQAKGGGWAAEKDQKGSHKFKKSFSYFKDFIRQDPKFFEKQCTRSKPAKTDDHLHLQLACGESEVIDFYFLPYRKDFRVNRVVITSTDPG